MRDIRPDLRERLSQVDKERQALQSRLSQIDQAEAGIRALLDAEEARFGTLVPSQPDVVSEAPANGHGTPLAKFIMSTASRAQGWLSLQDFKKAAEEAGLDFERKSPGRTLHWALVGLTSHGYLECQGTDEDRRYRIKT